MVMDDMCNQNVTERLRTAIKSRLWCSFNSIQCRLIADQFHSFHSSVRICKFRIKLIMIIDSLDSSVISSECRFSVHSTCSSWLRLMIFFYCHHKLSREPTFFFFELEFIEFNIIVILFHHFIAFIECNDTIS